MYSLLVEAVSGHCNSSEVECGPWDSKLLSGSWLAPYCTEFCTCVYASTRRSVSSSICAVEICIGEIRNCTLIESVWSYETISIGFVGITT